VKPTKSDPPQARKPYTPQPIQNLMVAEHLNGKSNREIGRITRRDPATVSRILSQPDKIRIIEEHQSRLFEDS